MNPLNSPIEIGMRLLAILETAYPRSMDIDRLMFLDHSLVHSADLGGPQSLHPPTPGRVGEVGVRRQQVESGLRVILRAGLAELDLDISGIQYIASEDAGSFLRLLEAPYVKDLLDHAGWAVQHFSDMGDARLREEIGHLTNSWAESSDE